MATVPVRKVTSHIDEKWLRLNFEVPTRRNHYEISNYGRIKSVDKKTGREKLLKGSRANHNFRALHLRLDNGVCKNLYLHRFVAENFVKQPTKEHTYILHMDYDKGNNKWTNLRWATDLEWKEFISKTDSVIKGKEKRRKHYKLNEEKVKEIKIMLLSKKKKMKKKDIAKKYNITPMQLNRIERGENWTHVQLSEDDLKLVDKD